MAEENKETTFDLFCEVSTCMGVIDWYQAKNLIGKIFWAIMLTCGLAVTAWQTQGVICQFVYREPYQTSISRDVMKEGIAYPNITVCNFNRAKQSLINETNLDPKVLSYVFQLTGVAYNCPLEIIPKLNVTEYEEAWKQHYLESNYSSPKDFYRRYGHTYNETVVLISVNGIPTPLDYEEVWTFYGRCFNIIPRNFNQTIAGSNFALRIILNPQIKEYMKDTIVNNYIQEGLIIVPNYHFQTSLPSPLLVAPGTFASISLSASKQVTVLEDTPLLPGDCQANTTLTILNETYTPQNCMFDCYLQYMYKKCGCVTLSNTKHGHRICNLTTMIHCASSLAMMHVKPDVFSKLLSAYTDRSTDRFIPPTTTSYSGDTISCMNQCRNPCDDFMMVEATMTTTNAVSRNLREPLLAYIKMFAHATKEFDDDFAQHFINVEMYFSSLEITIIKTEENIPLFTFIGNVGGQLGLWVGVSILTLVQCVYYFVVACLNGELCTLWKSRANSVVSDEKLFHSRTAASKISNEDIVMVQK